MSVIEAVRPAVSDETLRKQIYGKLIGNFEAEDWDTQDECMGVDPAFDAALSEVHPEYFHECFPQQTCNEGIS